jgi:hypothetical protein
VVGAVTRQQLAESILTCPRCDYGTCAFCRQASVLLIVQKPNENGTLARAGKPANS